MEKLCSEMSDTLGEVGQEFPLKDISFHATDFSSSPSWVGNLLGFLTVDGLLPSQLSLFFSSKLTDLTPGGTILMTVEPDTAVDVKAGWDKRVVIQVAFISAEGEEKAVRAKKKTEGGKRLLKFEASSAGIYKVTATLYEQHLRNSPYTIPVGDNQLQSVGLRLLEEDENKDEDCKARPSVTTKNESNDKAKKKEDTLRSEEKGDEVKAVCEKKASVEEQVKTFSCEKKVEEEAKCFREEKRKVEEEVSIREKNASSGISTGPYYSSKSTIAGGSGSVHEAGDEAEAAVHEDRKIPHPSKVSGSGTQAFTGRNVLVMKEGVKHEGVVHKKVSDELYVVKLSKSNSFMGALPSELVLVGDWNVGDTCLAMWSEDMVWYNARIIQCLDVGKYMVNFIDYGNSEEVSEAFIVSSAERIPSGGFIDHHVDQAGATQQTTDSQEGVSLEPEKEKHPNSWFSSSSEDYVSTSLNFQSRDLLFSDLVLKEIKTVNIIEAGVAISSMTLLNPDTLLCLSEEPREICLFDANTGMELGKLDDPTLTYPQAVLVLSLGGLVVSNGTHQGVHLFDGNLEYVQFIEIPQATVIIGICEKDDNYIYTLNYDYDITDCFILLTSLCGETTNKFNLTDLIEMGQMSSCGQFDGAAAMPMSNCRFITKYGQDIYVLGKSSLPIFSLSSEIF